MRDPAISLAQDHLIALRHDVVIFGVPRVVRRACSRTVGHAAPGEPAAPVPSTAAAVRARREAMHRSILRASIFE
jgi:hypothetical protein